MIGRVLAGMVGGGLALAAVPAAGQAEVVKQGGFSYVREDPKMVAPLATKTVAARCPGSTHVLSGGTGSEAGFGESFISSSYPFDAGDKDKTPDDGWKTKVSSFDVAFELDATAVCSRVRPTYRTRREPAGAAPGTATDPIVCGGGRDIVHGGLRGPTALRLVSSYPFDSPGGDSWHLQADNISNQPKTGTGYAVCSDELTVTYVSSASMPIPDGTQQSTNADCPPGAPNPVGGGPVAFGPVGGLRLSRTSADFDEWFGTLEASGSAGSFSVWADCVADL